jgi:hypothetical protein
LLSRPGRGRAIHDTRGLAHGIWNNTPGWIVDEIQFEIEEFEIQEQVEGSTAMSRLAKAVRSRRETRRTRRELEIAINKAATPSMRDELLLFGQRTDAFR